jgi:replicative DNA helicase
VPELTEKVPPQALEAERAVLGSMLIERHAVERALEWVEEKHFYQEPHRKIFRAVFGLFQQNQAADLVTVAEELRRAKLLDEAGGQAYLAELVSRVSTAAHVEYYAKIVREKAMVRELIHAGTNIVSRAFAEEKDVTLLLDEAEKGIFDIRQKHTQHGFVSSAVLAHDAIDQIAALHERKAAVTGVPTGFTLLDQLTGGFQKSDLIIIAARPSQGKTAFALNIAAHMVCVAKTPLAFFSLEMNRLSIMQRLICSEARADLGQVRKGFFRKDTFPELTNAASRLGEAPFFVDDTSSLSVLELRSRCRRLASDLRSKGQELGCVMVDYLQLMRGTDGSRREGRQQEVAEISRQLKSLARDMNVPVIALSQLSRRVEEKGREGKPMLSDLRESGSIEQDADVVMFIYRENQYKPAEEVDEEARRAATIIVAKQRNGPTDDVPLLFFREWTRFENPTSEVEVGAGPEQTTAL